MYRPARRNLVTDIAGLRVGHATDEIVRSGVTVLLCDGAWAAGVDVRGGGPGGRETDALAPEADQAQPADRDELHKIVLELAEDLARGVGPA